MHNLRPFPLLFAIAFLVGWNTLWGQIIAEDTGGESSIVVSSGASLNFNSANASIELSLANVPDTNNAGLYYSGFVSLRAVNGLSSVIEDGEIEPGGRVGAYFGYYLPSISGPDVWVVGKLEYGYEQYDIFQPDNPFDEQMTTEEFHALSGSLHLNGFFPDLQLRAGIAAGMANASNIEALEEVTVGEVETTIDTLTGRRRIASDESDEETAWEGDYEDFPTAFFNADLVKGLIEQKLAMTLFVHGRKIRVENYDVGIGFNFLKGPDPTDPGDFIGGVTFEFPDITGRNLIEQRFWKKMKITFTTSLPISL